MINWAQQNLWLVVAFIAICGYLLGILTNAWVHAYKADRDYNQNHDLLDEYLKNPLPPDEDDDWTGYQTKVRPETYATMPIAVPNAESVARHLALFDATVARSYKPYLQAIPVSPAPVKEGEYRGRHSAEGRNDVALWHLNHGTAEFRVVPTGPRVLRSDWRELTKIPELV